MTSKSIFTSRKSFQDAEFKAKMKGYYVISRTQRPDGTYVVFARSTRGWQQ